MAFKFNPITGSLDKTVSGIENPNESVTLKHSGTTVFKTLSDGVNIPQKLLHGHTSSRKVGNEEVMHQLEGTAATTGLSITRNSSTTAHSPKLILGKSAGNSTGSNAAVSENHVLGEIRFSGADGSTDVVDMTNYAASIVALVDDTVSDNVVPGRLEFRTATGSDATVKMTIDKDGKVGIGTTDPARPLDVNGSMRLSNDSVVEWGGTTASIAGSSSTDTLSFTTAGSERVRIDDDGRISINTTDTGFSSSSSMITIDPSGGDYGLTFKDVGLMNGKGIAMTAGVFASVGLLLIDNNGVYCGGINFGTNGTTFATISDYRIKENVVDITDGITRLKQLKPYRFNFKSDPTKTVDGFLAHEAQTVVPEAITGTKDEVDSDNNPVLQGIDQSKLVPLLVAAVQELTAKVEALEAA